MVGDLKNGRIWGKKIEAHLGSSKGGRWGNYLSQTDGSSGGRGNDTASFFAQGR